MKQPVAIYDAQIGEMTVCEIDISDIQPEPPSPSSPTELELLKQRQELTEQALQDLILMTMGGGG